MRDYKREWLMQQRRGKTERDHRAQRARAVRKFESLGIAHRGKDIDHIKPISKGGTNALSNLRLVSPSKNRSFARNPDRSLKRNGK